MSYNLEEKKKDFENNLFIFKAYILSESIEISKKIENSLKEIEKCFNNSWGNKRFFDSELINLYIDLYSIPLNKNQKSKMNLFFNIRNFKKIFNSNSNKIGLLLNQILQKNEDQFKFVIDSFKDNLTVDDLKYLSLSQLINEHSDKIKFFFKSDYNFFDDRSGWNYKIMIEALNNVPEKLETLVDLGFNVNSKKGFLNKTLLHEASIINNIEKVDLLLKLGADINAEDENHNTPLYDSYLLGGNKVFKHLLNNKAIVSNNMMVSLIENQDNIVYEILDEYTFNKSSSMEISAAIEFWPEIIPLLLTYKDINISNACNIDNSYNGISYTPIGRVLEKYKDDKVQQEKWTRILIEKGADINKYNFKDSLSFTNLQQARYAEKSLFLEIFKKTREPVFKNRPEVQNQIIISCFDFPDKLKFLIKKGYNIDCISGNDLDKQTPLFKAVKANKKEAVKILLENGANVLSRDKDRQTPLFVARDPEIIFMLLEYGSNPNIKNKNGIKLLDAASDKKRNVIQSYIDNKKLNKNFNKKSIVIKKKNIL